MNIKFNDLGYDIDLFLRSKLTVVEGDSGIGKTYLAEVLKALQAQPGVQSQVFVIQSKADMISLAAHSESAVLVDQMEQYTTSEQLLDCIHQNKEKYFLIFLRGQNRIPFGIRNIASLEVQRGEDLIKFRLQYSTWQESGPPTIQLNYNVIQ